PVMRTRQCRLWSMRIAGSDRRRNSVPVRHAKVWMSSNGSWRRQGEPMINAISISVPRAWEGRTTTPYSDGHSDPVEHWARALRLLPAVPMWLRARDAPPYERQPYAPLLFLLMRLGASLGLPGFILESSRLALDAQSRSSGLVSTSLIAASRCVLLRARRSSSASMSFTLARRMSSRYTDVAKRFGSFSFGVMQARLSTPA